MYKKVEELNLAQNEDEVLKFWKENDVKEKCLHLNKGKKMFSFFEGPPTANGQPHAGHVLTRALKDVFNRFKLMQGFEVPRKGGWDTHGLPVEISVEKEIGISGKQQIEEYGIEKFITACKQDVWKYVNLWKDFSTRIGYFVNMDDDCYVTYKDDYIESVWWSLKELNKKGLLYYGYKVLPCCPSCGTALSSHEVAQGYKQKTDLTAVAKFALADEDNSFFLAWTTTPWTLPSNIALCVNPKEKYVQIINNGTKYILAEALVSNFFKDGEYEIINSYTGKELEFKKYIPLFDFASDDVKANGYFVTCDNYVTLTDGTGIVHIAPAYGEDDSKVGQKYKLPFLQLANASGVFTAECGKYAGQNIFEINEQIAKDLLNDGKVFKLAKHTHDYPHCWRCKSPLMYFARGGWFVKTTAIKDKLIENNQQINWLPETIKDGRMGNWLANVIDWCLSRDRYWGTPLPVWKCECGHYHVIGSKQELKELGHLDSDIELHRPYVDNVTITCEKCGKQMTRVSDVIDCWYDSGSMPFAQFHYPFENKEEFERRYPADFISEGVDQCRGWFYTLSVLGTALFGKSPFKTCIANGMVVDDNGLKLSKSLNNYRPPMEIISQTGADAIRWSFYTTTQPWNNQPMSIKSASETIKNYFGTLWNTYSFFVLYAEIDKFDPSKYTLNDCSLSVMDKWVLSKFNKLVKTVTNELNLFHVTEASRAMQEFTDILSNWYIRRCRKRYWVGGFSEDKKSAYVTLWTILTEYAKLSAPFTPFVSETIYQNLVKNFFADAPVSIHLATYPVCNENFIDETLEQNMDLTIKYTELGRSARNLSNIKIRMPLSKLYLVEAQFQTNLPQEFLDIMKEELNVKEIIQNANLSEFVSYMLKPQLRTLGPKYGKLLGEISKHLMSCDTNKVVVLVKSGKDYEFEINGNNVSLNENDLLISVMQKEGYSSATDENMGAILDTTITEELKNEGIVREFVSKIQTMRKAANFNVVDRINIYINGEKQFVDVIMNYKKEISANVLALSINEGKCENCFEDNFEYDDFKLNIAISKN